MDLHSYFHFEHVQRLKPCQLGEELVALYLQTTGWLSPRRAKVSIVSPLRISLTSDQLYVLEKSNNSFKA